MQTFIKDVKVISTMRKTQVFVLVAAVVFALFTTIYFWSIPSGEPILRIEFNPAPPWHMRPGQNLQINITFKNEGKASAKNVNFNLTAPTGFVISQSGTNHYNGNFMELKEGEIKNQTLTLSILTTVAPGNYILSVIFYAENAPKESYNYQIIVELPT